MEAARIRLLLKRCASRVLNKSLSSAFKTWAEEVHERRRQASVGLKLLGRMRHRELAGMAVITEMAWMLGCSCLPSRL